MKDLLVSVEEYLSTTFEPDAEYVDGIILERNLGERDHSSWQTALAAFLYEHRKTWGLHVYTEWRMQVRPTRYRIPDLTVVAGQRPPDRVLRSAPFLVVEIWSPDDRATDMQQKIREYREFGIPYILLIYPGDLRFVLYTKDADQELLDGMLRTENPAIEVPLLDIHAEMLED